MLNLSESRLPFFSVDGIKFDILMFWGKEQAFTYWVEWVC
jgi:hypothetical protein